MSDISFNFEWWELVFLSPIWGWPGIVVGGIIGALSWKKRPIVGALLGAVAGNFAVALAIVYLM